MAIVPTDKIFFDGKECTDVYFEGHECFEAWYEVDGALECVWRKNTKLQPGDYVFTQSFGTSQGTNYVVYQYNAKTNSISSAEGRMIGSYGTASLFNDTRRNKAMQIIGNYWWNGGDLYFSDDGRNYQKFSERCADTVYLVGNGILTPTPDNQKGTSQAEWLFYEIDDNYNLVNKRNVTMPYTAQYNYDYICKNRYFKDGVFARKYVDTYNYDVYFIDLNGSATLIFKDDTVGDYIQQGHSQIKMNTLDIVYADGIYVALRSKMTRTFWYSIGTSQGTVYVYHYLAEMQLITSTDGIHWSDAITIHSFYGDNYWGSPSVSDGTGKVIYDAEKKRFVIYTQITETAQGISEYNKRGTRWHASIYEKGKGVTKHSALPDGYVVGSFWVACLSQADTPSGLTKKNFIINSLVDNTYWYKSGTYTRKSRFVTNLWTYNTAAVCMYADDMYLPDATEFKIFNY